MKVPAVLQRTLDSAVSVGSRIARRMENRNDDEDDNDNDEVTDSTYTTIQVLRSMDSVAVHHARIQRSRNKEHQRSSDSSDDSDQSDLDYAAIIHTRNGLPDANGVRQMGSVDPENEGSGGVNHTEQLPTDHTESPDSNGALPSHSRKNSDARVRFSRVDAAEPASGTETKTLASRRVRESFALGFFTGAAKGDHEECTVPSSLPQRVDSVTLTHRRMSMADPGHYGGSGGPRKQEARRATFSAIIRRQSIQQVSGSIRAVGRSFASSFASKPKVSMLTREVVQHPAVPSALKHGSRDLPEQGSGTSRRHSVHFDRSLDGPPNAL